VSITIKSDRELDLMRRAGRVVANALSELRDSARAGMTTRELDALAEAAIRRQGGEPAFPYINDFPGSMCVSVNEEVVHGIPGKRVLRDGDIVKFDIGAIVDGYHGDAAITVPIGTVGEDAQRLIEATENALRVGIEVVQPGAHLNDIGAAIERFMQPLGFSVVREYVGHGIGQELHEEPSVHHFRQATRGPRLRAGMVLAIEPMVNAGTYRTRVLKDGWTVVTQDRRLSAQFEHTVAVTQDGWEILTLPSEKSRAWSIPFQLANVVH
jgi:methionyl aminopeptidase